MDRAARRGRAHSSSPPVATTSATPTITFGVAALTWLVGWLAGNVAGSIALSSSGYASTDAAARPAWVSVVGALALWAPQIAVLVVVSRRFGVGRPGAD